MTGFNIARALVDDLLDRKLAAAQVPARPRRHEPRSASSRATQACFLRACELDVTVRKPGNVSVASPGHGMTAEQFIASAEAAAAPLFEPGRSGRRAHRARGRRRRWAAAGCNTNLGIVLLCAPIAAAAELERCAGRDGAAADAAASTRIERRCCEPQLDRRRRARGLSRHRAGQPGGLGTRRASRTCTTRRRSTCARRWRWRRRATRSRASTPTATPTCSNGSRLVRVARRGPCSASVGDGATRRATARRAARLPRLAARAVPIHTLFANTARPWHRRVMSAAQGWLAGMPDAAARADPISQRGTTR